MNSNANFSKKESDLISEIEWVKGIAQKIDGENQNLSKRYMDLKAHQVSHNEHDHLVKYYSKISISNYNKCLCVSVMILRPLLRLNICFNYLGSWFNAKEKMQYSRISLNNMRE